MGYLSMLRLFSSQYRVWRLIGNTAYWTPWNGNWFKLLGRGGRLGCGSGSSIVSSALCSVLGMSGCVSALFEWTSLLNVSSAPSFVSCVSVLFCEWGWRCFSVSMSAWYCGSRDFSRGERVLSLLALNSSTMYSMALTCSVDRWVATSSGFGFASVEPCCRTKPYLVNSMPNASWISGLL